MQCLLVSMRLSIFADMHWPLVCDSKRWKCECVCCLSARNKYNTSWKWEKKWNKCRLICTLVILSRTDLRVDVVSVYTQQLSTFFHFSHHHMFEWNWPISTKRWQTWIHCTQYRLSYVWTKCLFQIELDKHKYAEK